MAKYIIEIEETVNGCTVTGAVGLAEGEAENRDSHARAMFDYLITGAEIKRVTENMSLPQTLAYIDSKRQQHSTH